MRLTLKEFKTFTNIEMDIMMLSILDYKDERISEKLNISVDEVKTCIDSAIKKLNVKNREEANSLILSIVKHNMVESLFEK